MRIGKLTNDELTNNVIDVIGTKRPEVLSSAGISKDCAAVKCGDIILLTSDPITAASHIAGRLAIIVSSNDIAAGGGEPFCCLLTIIAPTDATPDDIRAVMTEAQSQAAALDIDIVGGHTEFSPSVNRTIVSCTMLGRTVKPAARKLQGGDSIIMTKYAGLEGTIIAANDKGEKLSLSDSDRLFVDGLAENLSVLKESKAVSGYDVLMHDITEGGVFGAIYEVCLSQNSGADIYTSDIPVLPVTNKICNTLGLDPYRLISSGSMLIFTDKPQEILSALHSDNIKAAKIGEINDTGTVRAFFDSGDTVIIDSGEDEICKLL
ncbi:MAG: AIR synthase [Clostridiales bacterium]|jgi:hydrogenase expression/formation protein HypE|nr:AIR synthase [Clostridiales bacterium]